MATRTNVCPGCLEAVPSGRMSCPSCGHVLASVAQTDGPVPTTADVLAADAGLPSPSIAGEPPVAGAWIPPAPTSPAPILLPARAWAGVTPAAPPPLAGPTSASPPPSLEPPTPAPAGASAGRHPPVAATTLPTAPSIGFQAGWQATVAAWLMGIGSALAILGFLLPWSRTVIGAEGAGTYFDTWGIASPSHVLVVLTLVATLGLSTLVNPIPTWIRTCCVGLALGGLLVGLTWPYLLGPLGAGPGVLAILVGGVVLGVAGILDLVAARHATPASAV